MATCKRDSNYTLSLTDKEAGLLRSLLGRHLIGASDGDRGHFDEIWGSLKKAGVSEADLEVRGEGNVFRVLS